MRPIRILLLALIVLGLVVPHAVAAESGVTELLVRVRTPAFEITDGAVEVRDYALNDTPGAPQLPVYGAVVELPAIGRWELDFVSSGRRVLEQRIAVRAAPVPKASQSGAIGGPGATDSSAVLVEERPDPAIYGRNAFYPESPVVAGAEQWQRGRRLLAVRVFPFQYNPVTGELQYHPDLTVIVRILPTQETATAGFAVETPSAVTNELGALRVRTNQQGMHRLTYDDLVNAGVPLNNPAGFAMTYLGQPIRIQVIGGEDGSFDQGDLVLFYARPYTGRWMPSNVYRFTYADQAAEPATRMTTRTVTPTGAEPIITTVTQVLRINPDKEYHYDYWIDTEADHFFDTSLKANTTSGVVVRSYDLALDDPITTNPLLSLTLQGLLYGYSDQAPAPDHWAQMKLNDHEVGVYQWDGRQPYAIASTTVPDTWLDLPTNQLHLVADQTKVSAAISEYQYYPDFVELSYPAMADAESDRINILALQGATTSAEVQVTGFTTNLVQVYDVRNPEQPVQLLTVSAADMGGAYRISFPDAWGAGDPAPSYWLSTNAALLAPVAIEVDQPTSWKSPAHEADYIAIIHTSLWDAVQPLLDRRAAEGFTIAKVNVQDIYDEFNYGHLHQSAIRDFLSYAYHNWNIGGSPPKYVLLVGDATVDFKGVTSTTLKDLVPPFLLNIDPWIVETAADNRFVSFDGPADYLPEMIISRISAQNATEVTNYVEKVAAYENKTTTPDGDWQNRVVYVADNKDDGAGNFHALSDDIRLTWLPPDYESRTVYYKSSASLDTGGEMRAAIKGEFDNTAVYLQWFGHASRFRWGGETSMWNINDPPTLISNTKLPFVAAYSCWDGYFHNIDFNYSALAEKHLLQQGRGSIGNLSPSGQHVGSALSILDQGLTKSFFQDRIATMGDAVDAAKLYYWANSGAFPDVIDTSILFGDPALKLRLPPLPPVAPDVAIGRGVGPTIDLSWPHLEPDASYQVWRGASPYFDPASEGLQVGTVDAQAAGYAVGDPVYFTDDGTIGPVQVVGDVNNNYFWVVRGANWRGVSGNSNRVGEFDFTLAPGK